MGKPEQQAETALHDVIDEVRRIRDTLTDEKTLACLEVALVELGDAATFNIEAHYKRGRQEPTGLIAKDPTGRYTPGRYVAWSSGRCSGGDHARCVFRACRCECHDENPAEEPTDG